MDSDYLDDGSDDGSESDEEGKPTAQSSSKSVMRYSTNQYLYFCVSGSATTASHALIICGCSDDECMAR